MTRGSSGLFCAIATVVLTLAIVGSASAQSDDVSDLEARARFESGRLAFEAGRYEEALADFRRSHDLSGRPAILFNLGLAHDRLRQDAAAITNFERYLAEVPDAPNRADVLGRIAVLRRVIAEREAAAAAVASSAPTHFAHYEIGGWTASVVAIGAAVGAGALWALASDRYAQLDARCGEAGCSRAEIDASGAPGLVTGTNVLLVSAIVSALCAATAWTLYFVDVPSPSGTALRVGPGTMHLTF